VTSVRMWPYTGYFTKTWGGAGFSS